MITTPMAGFDLESTGQVPTQIELYALWTIVIWISTVKCAAGIHFWAFLIRFHDPKIDSSQTLASAIPENWLRYHVLFLGVGFFGMAALAILYNATDFGLASGPWILAAMIGVTAFGSWRINQGIRSNEQAAT